MDEFSQPLLQCSVSPSKPILLKQRSSGVFILTTVCVAIFTDSFLYGVVSYPSGFADRKKEEDLIPSAIYQQKAKRLSDMYPHWQILTAVPQVVPVIPFSLKERSGIPPEDGEPCWIAKLQH